VGDLIVARNNRWVLASNSMPIVLARWWGSAADVRREYPGYGPVTDAEFTAALAFSPFPAITETARITSGGAVVCRCGENLPITMERRAEQCAYCGRRYRVRLEEVTDETQ